MRATVTVFIVLGLAVTADAGDRCAAGKMKAATRAAGGEAKCWAKPGGTSGPVTCLDREEVRLVKAFVKAEAAPPCRTVSDVGAIDALVDAFVSDVVGQVAPPGATGKCPAAKLTAASKAAVSMGKCHATALRRGEVPDDACVIKAETKLADAFAKAEATGTCATTGDASIVRDALVSVMSALATQLLPPIADCSGACFHGSYCEGADCPNPVCHAPDSPYSLMMCGGFVDNCCGSGFCVGSSYCDPGTAPSCMGVCFTPDEHISQVVCGGGLPGGCGVGTCIGGSYCNDCLCYDPTSAVSQILCECAQTGSATFEKVYVRGASGYNHATAGRETADNGFIMVGFANSQHADVVRTDATGEIIWAKRYLNFRPWWGVTETSNGFAMTGLNHLTRIDANGNVIWSRQFPGTGRAVETTPSGGFVVTGEIGNDVFLLETDGTGALLWQQRYGTPGNEAARSVVATGGGYLVMGATDGVGNGASDLLLIRTDATGSLLWAKSIGGAGSDTIDGNPDGPYRMVATSDGGFAIATATTSFGQGEMDIFVVKLDPNGDVTWATTVGGVDDDAANAIGERPGGGYFVLGEEHTFGGGLALVALEANGALGWARSYGPDAYFNYLDGGVAFDGGAYIITESHTFPLAGPSHWFYLLKTDAGGLTHGCCDPTDVPLVATSALVTAVPQPSVVVQVVPPMVLTPELLPPTSVAMERKTICESSPDYLCNGILTGDCPCGG